jgi:hypothetical protein
MPRRYLSDTEIDQRLRRGRSVEAFLGGGLVEGQRTIRWIVLRYDSDHVRGELWEALDPRDPEWLDVYSFGTPDEEDEPSTLYQFDSLQDGLAELDRQIPNISQRFVNQGVVQNEYAHYLANDV